jgi:hypothetical protein
MHLVIGFPKQKPQISIHKLYFITIQPKDPVYDPPNWAANMPKVFQVQIILLEVENITMASTKMPHTQLGSFKFK